MNNKTFSKRHDQKQLVSDKRLSSRFSSAWMWSVRSKQKHCDAHKNILLWLL